MSQNNELKNEIKSTIEWLKNEYSVIRAGNATPVLFESVKVNLYDTKTPLTQIASIIAEDSKSIVIEPYDKNIIKDIAQAIEDSDIDTSLVVGDTSIRALFAEFTSDKREKLIALAKAKLEEAKISIKGAREKAVNLTQEMEKSGNLSEDEKFKNKKEIQEIVDDAGKQLEDLAKNKTEELKTLV